MQTFELAHNLTPKDFDATLFLLFELKPPGGDVLLHWLQLQRKTTSLVQPIRLDDFLLGKKLHPSAVCRLYRDESLQESLSLCSDTIGPHWSAIFTPPNSPTHDPLVAICRCSFAPIAGMIRLECRKEWCAWRFCLIKLEMTLYIFIYGHIFQITWVDWLWYTWSEARYTAINVRPSLSLSVPWLLTRG